jgi:hypothetical protein
MEAGYWGEIESSSDECMHVGIDVDAMDGLKGFLPCECPIVAMLLARIDKTVFRAMQGIMRKMFRYVLFLAMLSLSADILASPSVTCSAGDNLGDLTSFRLFRVAAKGGAYIYFDMPGCPIAGDKCRMTDRLPYNETVVVTAESPVRLCVRSPSGGTGFIARGDLLEIDLSEDRSTWMGRWSLGPDYLDISRKGSILHVHGRASYNQGGSKNFGSVDADASLVADGAKFEEGGCELALRKVGQLLMASDNGGCGGLNVSFDGIYTKKK